MVKKQKQKQKQTQNVIVNVNTGGRKRGRPKKTPSRPPPRPPVAPNFPIGPRSDPFIPREYKQPSLSDIINAIQTVKQPVSQSIEKTPTEEPFIKEKKTISSAIEQAGGPFVPFLKGSTRDPSLIKDVGKALVPNVVKDFFGFGTEPNPKALTPIVPPIQAPSATIERTPPTPANPFIVSSPPFSVLADVEARRRNLPPPPYAPPLVSPFPVETQTFIPPEPARLPPPFVPEPAPTRLVPEQKQLIPETETLVSPSEDVFYDPEEVFTEEPIVVEGEVIEGPSPELPIEGPLPPQKPEPLPQPPKVESSALIQSVETQPVLKSEVETQTEPLSQPPEQGAASLVDVPKFGNISDENKLLMSRFEAQTKQASENLRGMREAQRKLADVRRGGKEYMRLYKEATGRIGELQQENENLLMGQEDLSGRIEQRLLSTPVSGKKKGRTSYLDIILRDHPDLKVGKNDDEIQRLIKELSESSKQKSKEKKAVAELASSIAGGLKAPPPPQPVFQPIAEGGIEPFAKQRQLATESFVPTLIRPKSQEALLRVTELPQLQTEYFGSPRP